MLHNEIGLNSSKTSGVSTLGISLRKVELTCFNSFPLRKKFDIAFHTSCLMHSLLIEWHTRKKNQEEIAYSATFLTRKRGSLWRHNIDRSFFFILNRPLSKRYDLVSELAEGKWRGGGALPYCRRMRGSVHGGASGFQCTTSKIRTSLPADHCCPILEWVGTQPSYPLN